MEASLEDGDLSPTTAASSSSKTKSSPKKLPTSKTSGENETEELPKKEVFVKLRRMDDYMTNGKVPLLDQNPIIEGSRKRKTVNQLPVKSVHVKKRGSQTAIEIPNGRGKALGRITNTYNRIKALDDFMIKNLHRGLFGKAFGKQTDLLNNIMQFRGFAFKKDSDEYNQKIVDLSKKFSLQEMKLLFYSFDLAINYKAKEEAVRCILDFLMDPQPSKNPKPALEGHPRRKATKRDYFEADLSLEYTKKKKKKTATNKPEEDSSSKKQTKKSHGDAETSEEKDEPEKGDNESANEKDDESNKPAKKRKSNQVIEEESEKETLENGELQPTKAKKKKGGKN